ncbi:DUF4114 domain-containing protein [Cyanobacterium aponinum]|uniref:DUF4114 domain-containing protein n=1 Tax=Cyanobacterium aponinum (strain PCC 10605) TaxID=755178 RepID=K9Z337_CYAAP|nr:DUF4114 domain-containing protein [Cyanobacterium aponinum]AFZ53621.1 hypothetical protein Cyan10605_1511 [Cyanobacterium aponinum PCC 10605]
MTIEYTSLADQLIAYLANDRSNTSGKSSSLNTSILLNADLFGKEGTIITANYGFEGYMGIPGMTGTDQASQDIAFANNVSWQDLGGNTTMNQRAYTSAISTDTVQATYDVDIEKLDNIPVVFSFPLLPTTVNPTDFRITRNDGVVVTPVIASFLPNAEYNERQTVVITGEFGNRGIPGTEGAIYPVSVSTVLDSTPLEMIGEDGLMSAVGITVDSQNPYVVGNGPKMVTAKLNRFSDLGEGAPLWLVTNQNNSGSDLYGEQALFRLRIYTSAGFSPDGIASILPTDYQKFFLVKAEDSSGNIIELVETGVDYEISGFGSIRVEGLADLSLAQPTYDNTYIEDHDNYYDIILSGDEEAINQIKTVELPSSGDYSVVYNPGGPGNNPSSNPEGPFTVPSTPHQVNVDNDINRVSNVSYVEVDGAVMRNPYTGQPIGENMGVAVKDLASGYEIYQYLDPDGKVFYASFSVSTDLVTDLTDELTSPTPINFIDARELTQGESFTVSGSYSREAAFNSEMGFYRILNESGAVLDPLTGTEINPTEAGYVEVALSESNRLSTSGSTLAAENFTTKSFAFSIFGGELYAPFLKVDFGDFGNGSEEIYFPFAGANSDKLDHVTNFGANVIGFEDLNGGGDRDFDDIILRFSIT